MDKEDVELYYEVFKTKKYITVVYDKKVIWFDLDNYNNILVDLIGKRKDILLCTINLTRKEIEIYEYTPLIEYILPLMNRLLQYESR
jgi:hypothetical protein